VPFHKLTGWTTYSLIEPIEKILGWKFDGLEDMTGLPEYRNGACMWSRGTRLARRQFVELAHSLAHVSRRPFSCWVCYAWT
jgi:hypothetical protein